MKITLKRVILCGGMLLSALFFLLVLVVPIHAYYGSFQYDGKWATTPLSIHQSFLAAGGSKGFHAAYLWGFSQSILSGSDAKEAASVLATAADGTLNVMTIIGLVFVIIDFLAIVGAFFLKTQKGARKLIIPFMAISIVVMFLVIVIPGSLLCQSHLAGEKAVFFGDAELGTLFILLFVAVGLFIGSLVAAGVVKDKVLVGKKD